jgi:hypothetical protein
VPVPPGAPSWKRKKLVAGEMKAHLLIEALDYLGDNKDEFGDYAKLPPGEKRVYLRT